MDIFDFNHNGQTEPYEVAIGASLIGSAGYGAGLSEADSRARHLRDEYDEELKRKQDRIDELEDELEELRNSYDDDDASEDDENDADDYDPDDIYGTHNDNTDSFGSNDYALNYSNPQTHTSGIDWSHIIISKLYDARRGEDITGLIKEAIKDKAHFTPREIIYIASSINDPKTTKQLIEAADENTHFTPIDVMDISYHLDDPAPLKKIIATSEPKFMPEDRSLLAPQWQSIDLE